MVLGPVIGAEVLAFGGFIEAHAVIPTTLTAIRALWISVRRM
jgi:hypothetical protein